MWEFNDYYGVTLTEKDNISQFDVHDVEVVVPQKLVIKQILLDDTAKAGEFNVVQVETKNSDKETLKIPIAVLKAGETRTLRPNIEFPCPSVTFKLIQGSGPVHINGMHLINEQYQDEFYQHEDDEELEDDEDDDVVPPQTNGKNSNKKK